MHELSTTLTLPHSADRVWSLIGDFAGLDRWFPGVEVCEVDDSGEYTERKVRLRGDQQVRERLIESRSDARRLRYEVVEAPGVPQDMRFVATVSVYPEGEAQSQVRWSAEFNLPEAAPERMAEAVRERATAMYDAALAHLAAALQREN